MALFNRIHKVALLLLKLPKLSSREKKKIVRKKVDEKIKRLKSILRYRYV